MFSLVQNKTEKMKTSVIKIGQVQLSPHNVLFISVYIMISGYTHQGLDDIDDYRQQSHSFYCLLSTITTCSF